jgi:four helix bundle protein
MDGGAGATKTTMLDEHPPVRKARGYRDLLVWQNGMAMAKQIYQLTREFPNEEKFGLVAQMRRAAVSIPSNISEGQARNSSGEFVRFISMAEGSLAELDTQVQLSVDLDFANPSDTAVIFEAISELQRMLNGLRRAIAAKKAVTSDKN